MPKTFKATIKMQMKRFKYRFKNVVIHHSTIVSGELFKGAAVIEPYCRVNGDKRIVFGNNFYMNAGCHLLGDIEFGDDVLVGPKTVIWGRDHGITCGVKIREQPHQKEPIRVGNNVWIAANVTILKGVTIGDGAVIGAGAVVTKDIPKNAIAVGNPAKVIKFRE